MKIDPWPTELSPRELAAWLNGRLDGTLMGHLGIRIVEAGKERAVAELPVRSGLLTLTGHVHTGTMVSLADTSATCAAIAICEGWKPERFPVAIALSIQIVGNVQQGILRAESAIAHAGRTLIAAETRITSDSGRLLAIVNSTHFVRQQG
jgi:uncharacterized protein (TIGR00369 family)